jgi:CRISPR/Cas system-associated protein endoribonuclease Cas2
MTGSVERIKAILAAVNPLGRWFAIVRRGITAPLSAVKAFILHHARRMRRPKGETVITVTRVPVPSELLRKMTNEERVFFLLMGHAENQISVMFKVLRFATNNDRPSPIEQLVAGNQTQIVLRLIIGLLFETWEKLVKPRFLNRSNVHIELTDKGKTTVDKLNTHFSESGLLGKIRNSFAFHYPNDEYMNKAFKAASEDDELAEHWNWYLSNARTNTCYYVSELVDEI